MFNVFFEQAIQKITKGTGNYRATRNYSGQGSLLGIGHLYKPFTYITRKTSPAEKKFGIFFLSYSWMRNSNYTWAQLAYCIYLPISGHFFLYSGKVRVRSTSFTPIITLPAGIYLFKVKIETPEECVTNLVNDVFWRLYW